MDTNIPEIKAAYRHTKAGNFLFKLCAGWTKFIIKHRWLYYALACTWGIIMTVIGAVVSGILAIAKLFLKDKITFRPYHWVYGISVGPAYWGGLELGLCFLRDHRSASTRLEAHEFGHTFQNTLFGPLFIFLVWIPSAVWYWSNELGLLKQTKSYDSMWFEDAATQCGMYAAQILNAKKEA
jgi:hypothetical protein